MSKPKIIVSVLLISFFFVRPVYSTFITDLIAYSKMAIEFKKHLKALNNIVETTKKLKKDFSEFKGRFSKIHSGIKKEALDALLSFKDIEFYYNSPYVRISKSDSWKNVWDNTKNLFKKLPFLKDHSSFKDTNLYKKNREYKKRMDYRIEREEQIYKEYENILKMIADSRKIISKSSTKYKNIEGMIRNFTKQRSTGKLIGLLCKLKLEQLVKMDILITSLRMKMEMTIKERITRMDIAKKREFEIHLDRKRNRKIIEGDYVR